MEVSYIEDLASHNGPESCVCAGDFADEALTGGDVGRVLSRERTKTREPTLWDDAEGDIACSDTRELYVDPARSETLSMHPSTLCGNREIPPLITIGVVVRVENSQEVTRQ